VGKLDGKVAFISGVARNQGRSHALTLAQEGADIIGFDICRKIDSSCHSGATESDLLETVRLVEKLGRRIVVSIADVREYDQVQGAFSKGLDELGRCDIVLANAGIFASGKFWEIELDAWQEMIGINLTGVWHTVRAAAPTMIAQNQGGAIVITGSTESLKGMPNTASYSAAKHGLTGLMRTMANELGEYGIRVNTVNPTCVETDMVLNRTVFELFRPDLVNPTREEVSASFAATNIIPVDFIPPRAVSEAILYLVADTGKYVTGVPLPVDAGFVTK
jgi:(+)-trans-carveol dehydrogenase